MDNLGLVLALFEHFLESLKNFLLIVPAQNQAKLCHLLALLAAADVLYIVDDELDSTLVGVEKL